MSENLMLEIQRSVQRLLRDDEKKHQADMARQQREELHCLEILFAESEAKRLVEAKKVRQRRVEDAINNSNAVGKAKNEQFLNKYAAANNPAHGFEIKHHGPSPGSEVKVSPPQLFDRIVGKLSAPNLVLI